jgi:hypothetical protein
MGVANDRKIYNTVIPKSRHQRTTRDLPFVGSRRKADPSLAPCHAQERVQVRSLGMTAKGPFCRAMLGIIFERRRS